MLAWSPFALPFCSYWVPEMVPFGSALWVQQGQKHMRLVPMKNTHHVNRSELVIGPNLEWLLAPRL